MAEIGLVRSLARCRHVHLREAILLLSRTSPYNGAIHRDPTGLDAVARDQAKQPANRLQLFMNGQIYAPILNGMPYCDTTRKLCIYSNKGPTSMPLPLSPLMNPPSIPPSYKLDSVLKKRRRKMKKHKYKKRIKRLRMRFKNAKH